MEFLTTVQARERLIKENKLDGIPIIAEVALYDDLVSFDGRSICLEGTHAGQLQSTYPVTRKSRAEIYTTPKFAHYVFADDNGFIRTFTMQAGATLMLDKFRKGSTAMGILRGEYKLDHLTTHGQLK